MSIYTTIKRTHKTKLREREKHEILLDFCARANENGSKREQPRNIFRFLKTNVN